MENTLETAEENLRKANNEAVEANMEFNDVLREYQEFKLNSDKLIKSYEKTISDCKLQTIQQKEADKRAFEEGLSDLVK